MNTMNHIRWGANPEPKAINAPEFTAIADSLKPQTIPLLFAVGRFCLHGVYVSKLIKLSTQPKTGNAPDIVQSLLTA